MATVPKMSRANSTAPITKMESPSLNEGTPKEEGSPSRSETGDSSTLYPKILKLSDFLYAAEALGPVPSIHLTGSAKLHGTHADIVFSPYKDVIRLQSRNKKDLVPGKEDNAGFAAFVASIPIHTLLALRDKVMNRFRQLNPRTELLHDIVVSGEWCGTGIQRKVALAQVPRFFAIISININQCWVPDGDYADISEEEARIFHISKAGFFEHELRFDDVEASKVKIKALTDAVEAECPFAKAMGVCGLGEGIVWKATRHCTNPKFWFKTKGDLHAVSHSASLPVSAVAEENRERIDNFAKAIVTEMRLEQGWENLGQKDARGLGDFLKWVINDCLVEEKREMEGLKIDKSKLKPAIAAITKPWFWAKIEEGGRETDQR